jgi:hypothetical protein
LDVATGKNIFLHAGAACGAMAGEIRFQEDDKRLLFEDRVGTGLTLAANVDRFPCGRQGLFFDE